MATEASIPSSIETIQLQNDEQATSSDPLSKLKTDLRLVIEKLNEVCQVNTAMLNKISELVAENNKLYDEVEEQKIELAELNQYGRRENIEICGIPENIEVKKLEEHVISVLKSIGVTVSSFNVVAVHRIGKKTPSRPRNVIVRFVNRKHAFSALKNKKKLNNSKHKKYYIIENLCPYNKKIFNRLYKLKKENELHSVWSYNGLVYAKIDEHDEPTNIRHLLDIDELFEGSQYEEDGGEGEEGGAEPNNTTSELDSSKKSQPEESSASNNTGSYVITPTIKTRSQRRLSDIAEESNIRSPIVPLQLRQINV